MNHDRMRRLDAVETAVALHGQPAKQRSRIDELLAMPADQLSDAEAIEVWRWLCRQPAPAQRPEPFSPDEQAELLAMWRRLTAKPGVARQCEVRA